MDDALHEHRVWQRLQACTGVPGLTKGWERVTQEWYLCTGGTGSGHDVPHYASGSSSPGWCYSQMPRENAGWLWVVRLPSLTSGPVQGHPRASVLLTFIWELPSEGNRHRMRGAARGNPLIWGSLSPKTLCPQSRLEKWGFRANPLGLMSHRSRQERRKIPRLRRQDWAGGQRKLGEEADRPTARICSNHGPPEQLDRAVCVLSRAQVACHTHLNRLPQAWAHLSWDPHEPGRRISHAAGTRRPGSWLHAALDLHRPLGLRVPCPPFGSFMCSHIGAPSPLSHLKRNDIVRAGRDRKDPQVRGGS